MATIKISELTKVNPLNSNTSNVSFIGTDTQTGVSGRYTATTIANGLYANNPLNVGNNAIVLPNTVAQFALDGQSYIQTNLVNTNDGGTADYVVTANSGTDSTYFLDAGYANKDYQPGSEYNNIGTAVNPLDGYLYVQGSLTNTTGGNLIIGSTTTGKEVRVIAGGGSLSNVVAKLSDTTIRFNRSVTFADGTTQNTSFGAAGSYANSAFNTSNAAFIQANAAYNKANSALANTSGTLNGDLFITGNTVVQKVNTSTLYVVGTANVTGSLGVSGTINGNAQIILSNTIFTASQSAVTISATDVYAAPSNDGYMIHVSGKNGVPSRIVNDSYGTGAYGLLAMRSARGNTTNPSAVQTNDVIGRLAVNGFGTTKYQTLGTGRIDFVASENYTDSATGTQIQFWNCAVGSNNLVNIATFNGSSAVFTGMVNPQKGFVYTPRILTGNQTSITIDYSSDSMVKANLIADLAVLHSNFTAGKVVEVWLTNSGGTQRTITHGCAAINSTINSTTFTVPATSSAYLRYFCINGDLANTFVTISHA